MFMCILVSYLLHADLVALLDPAAHAVVPLGHVHRAAVVPAGAHAALAVSVPPGKGMQDVLQGFRVEEGLSCVIGPFGRQGQAATLRQHCPQMTQRRCI